MTLPPLARKLLTLLMVVLMLPGLPELIESAEHLLHDGHLPHSEQHEQVASAEAHQEIDEHGCSPMAHHCSCHRSVPVLPPADTPLPWVALLIHPTVSPAIPSRPVSWAHAPPTPPPTA